MSYSIINGIIYQSLVLVADAEVTDCHGAARGMAVRVHRVVRRRLCLDVLAHRGWLWDRQTVFSQAVDVEIDGFADAPLRLVERGTGGDASRKVGDVDRT